MKKLIAGLFIILFHCNFAVSNISGAQQLFCSGIFEDRRVFENSGTCYSPEWLETVISEQIPRDQLPNHITVRNYNASLIIRTDPAADSLQYTIKGLHKDAVTIRKNANSLSIIEQEIRPRNRQTGNPWDRIIADIELIIPLSATLQTVSIESVIESAEITALSCETLTVKQSVGQITAADIHCSTLNITGNVAPLTLKNILCSTCDIRTSTANTTIENFTATDRAFFHTSTGAMRIINGQLNNPSLSLTGSFDFTGSIQGDVRLNGGIGRIDMDLQNSEKIGQFDIDCSTGSLRLNNFSAEGLTLTLSTGNTHIEQADIGSAKISASTGTLMCDNCVLNNADIRLSTGSFDFSGILTGDTYLRRSTGSIKLNINAPEDTYRVFFNGTANGDNTAMSTENITINGQSGFIAGNKNAAHTLRIQGGTGKCSIRFLQ